MPSPNNTTNITPPRVPLIDERSGFVSREWYRFFLNLFTLTGSGTNVTSLTDLQLGPPAPQQEDIIDIVIDVEAAKIQPTQESALDQIAELAKQVEALSVLPLTSWVLSELAELQSQIDGLSVTSVLPVSFLTNGSSILYGDNLGGFSNVAIGSGVSFSGGTLSATGSGGTVTSVGQTFTGGLISVAGSPITTSGTLALTVAGTSGGVPYFSSASTWASSAALAANALVVGGGAGATPATITTGTGVVTALGVNTGTAGAFVVNGGALGTPSSGTVTNLTGTASININGTVGATTPTTGSFTNITGSANAIISVTDNTNAALRITQLGTGNALLIEDNTNPDSTPFVIDASGNVGIGATTASQKLDLSSDGTLIIQSTRYSTDASEPAITIRKARGTGASPSIVSSGDTVTSLNFQGYDGAAFLNAARIFAQIDGTPGTNDMPGRLVFSTTADGANASTARARIDSAGYLQQLTAPILPYQGAPTSKAAAATLTGAELVTGILNTTGLTYTITLPTGANIESALSWAGNNVALDWWVVNTASGVITIGANGNTTLGLLTIAAGVSAYFRIRRTAANTFTVYRLS